MVDGDYTYYSGGFLRKPPSESRTDREKCDKVKGQYLTLVTGKGRNTKDPSKFITYIS